MCVCVVRGFDGYGWIRIFIPERKGKPHTYRNEVMWGLEVKKRFVSLYQKEKRNIWLVNEH